MSPNLLLFHWWQLLQQQTKPSFLVSWYSSEIRPSRQPGTACSPWPDQTAVTAAWPSQCFTHSFAACLELHTEHEASLISSYMTGGKRHPVQRTHSTVHAVHLARVHKLMLSRHYSAIVSDLSKAAPADPGIDLGRNMSMIVVNMMPRGLMSGQTQCLRLQVDNQPAQQVASWVLGFRSSRGPHLKLWQDC